MKLADVPSRSGRTATIDNAHRACVIGDSLGAQTLSAGAVGSGDIDEDARGWFNQAQMRLGYPWYLHAEENQQGGLGFAGAVFAKGGATTADVVALQIPQVRAFEPEITFCIVGTNDIRGGDETTADTVMDNLGAIFAACLPYGPVVCIPVLPRNAVDGAADWTTDERSIHNQVNARLYAIAGETPNLYVPDISRMYNGGDMITGYTTDSVHLSTSGAQVLGECVRDMLTGLVSGYRQLLSSVGTGSLFNTTYNPYGNFLPSGDWSGTSGSSTGTVIGDVPTGWVVDAADADITVTVSLPAVSPASEAPFNGQFYRLSIAIAGGGSGSSYVRVRESSITGMLEGDYLQGACMAKIGASSGGAGFIDAISLKAQNKDGAAARASAISTGKLEDKAVNWMMLSQPIRAVAADSWAWEFRVDIDLTGAAETTVIEVARPMLRKMSTEPEYPVPL